MVKQLKSNRVVFPAGKQQTFLKEIGSRLSTTEMARVSNCSERTIRAWRRAEFLMPLTAVKELSRQARVPIPKEVRIQDAYAHIARASKMGIAVVMKKYGGIPRNEKRRKERWDLWWETVGRFKKNPILAAKNIYKPNQNVDLAEFIGIMMGDGGISEYQVVVTLHHIDDLEYSAFVTRLIERLFKIKPSIYHSPMQSVNDIVVSRKQLVDYLHELGLPIGNKVKQGFDIPEWIKQNHKFSIACLRGLIDTDGSIFTHRYKSKGRWYTYKKLSFTSASEPLRRSVSSILGNLGFHPRITSHDVRLDRVEDMKKYFVQIGSHNPKHLRRYKNAVE